MLGFYLNSNSSQLNNIRQRCCDDFMYILTFQNTCSYINLNIPATQGHQIELHQGNLIQNFPHFLTDEKSRLFFIFFDG